MTNDEANKRHETIYERELSTDIYNRSFIFFKLVFSVFVLLKVRAVQYPYRNRVIPLRQCMMCFSATSYLFLAAVRPADQSGLLFIFRSEEEVSLSNSRLCE